MNKATCTIDGCERTHRARGYCSMHYRRWIKHGDPLYEPERRPEQCIIDGCEKPHFARGWCSAHYTKWSKYGNPLTQRYGLPSEPCQIAGCEQPGNEGHGWCAKHYRRFWRHGDPKVTSRIVGDDVARFESYLELGCVPDHDPSLGRCWLWTGLLNRDDYGVMASDLPTSSAHRWSYRHHVGDLPPEGWDLDHLCRVRHCVNPAHLEPVPHEVNVQRANAVTAAKQSA